MMKRTCLSIAALGLAAPALGQIGALDSEYPSYEPSATVRSGFTAEDLRDAEVRGVNGDKIGEIEDLIIGPKGQLRRLIVSVNEGWFGTGGRQLAVNWEDVKPGPKSKENDYRLQYVTVPVTKSNVEEFGLFKDKPDAVKGRAREWRASELVGDYISLKDMNDAGTVSDLMFDKQGQLRAIAAAPDITGSLFPFYARYSGDDKGWDPGDQYYEIPYTRQEIAELLPEDQARKAGTID